MDNQTIYILTVIIAIVASVSVILLLIRSLKISKNLKLLEAENIELNSNNKSLNELICSIEKTKVELIAEIEVQKELRKKSEISESLAKQELSMTKQQMSDWEKTKSQHLEAAKSSMLEASTNLSNKLLEDHKRESEAIKKQSEEKVKQTTEELHQKFQNVFESMKSLSDQVGESKKTVNLINNSLLNPQGAGSLAEIALENIFKNSGLTKDRDYFIQYSVSSENIRLRPDAIVFLPMDSVLVIDSKSSKFFLESSDFKDDEHRAKLEQSLKNSVNKHLNDLISKSYKEAVEEDLIEKKKISKRGDVYTIMFLPTDVAAERVRSLDSALYEKAWKNNIIPVGPSGLVNILMQAKVIIEKSKQEENYIQIIEEIEKLLESVAKLHDHADGLGKNLKIAMVKYDNFAGSFNRNLLGKLKKLSNYGVVSKKAEELIPLKKYEQEN